MWPFGTSTKDRKRIGDLERAVRELLTVVNETTGRRISGLGADPVYYYLPSRLHNLSLDRLSERISALQAEQSEIMAATGLERYTQPSKTWIAKKGKS